MSELKRSLTLTGLTMVAVGGTIGSGIFRTPGGVAEAVHLQEYVILLWVLGGIVALTGALTFAEVGSMFPGAGGLYVYLREAYGDLVAFLYGWLILFVSTSGAIAALAMVASEHILFLLGYGMASGWVMPLAVFITIFLTVVNLFGVQVGDWIAKIFTGTKLAGLALIILAGLFFANADVPDANAASVFANTPPESLWSAFAVGFMGVLWSVGGWHHASYVAGEAKNPQRTVPLAMMLGAGIVTLVYVLANLAYLRLLPIEQLAHSQTVAADALQTISPLGGSLMAFLIALSTFGSTGIYCMTAPRIYFAMAKDGIFFKKLAEIHPKWQTPVNAILIQSAWSLFLLFFWGTFKDLMEYVTFLDFIGLMLTGTTIFYFRKHRPEAPRSYRTIGYPIVPLIFVAILIWFIGFNILENPTKVAAGVVVFGVGWLAFRYFKAQA